MIKFSRELIGEFQLILSIIFFGVSFVGQRIAMSQGIGPLTYNSCRFIVSTLLLLAFRPLIQFFIASEYESGDESDTDSFYSNLSESEKLNQLWIWGSVCGIANFAGSVLQQIALITVPVAKVGFITGMYVVVVPIIEWFIPKRSNKIKLQSWIAVIICVIGMYFLSGCADTSNCLSGVTGFGELLTIISVLFWSISILGSDVGAKSVDCVSLTCVDFLICTILNLVLALIYEFDQWKYPFELVSMAWLSILVVGFTEASAFLLSTLGQMYTPPTRASILLSLETVSSAIGGYIVLNEKLSYFELFGGFLMFFAALISSIDWSFEREEKLLTRSLSLTKTINYSTYAIILDKNDSSDTNESDHIIVELQKIQH